MGRRTPKGPMQKPLPPVETVPDICPHCRSKQFFRERHGYSCLICGYEVLTATDAELQRTPTRITGHATFTYENTDPGWKRRFSRENQSR